MSVRNDAAHVAASPLLLGSRAAVRAPSAAWLGRAALFALCFAAALVGLEAWQLWQVRDSDLRSAEAMSASLANSVSQQAETTLKTADTIVATLVERVEAEGRGPESLQRLYALMTSLASALPAIHEMGITDENGTAIVKSLVRDPHGVNYGERDYFRYHATHADAGPYVGLLVRSKIDGSANVTVSRRFNRPDGSFGGVVVTSVSMAFFQNLFHSVQIAPDGVISLLADDGMLLARSPEPQPGGAVAIGAADPDAAALRRPRPDGTVQFVSAVEGAARIGSVSHLRLYPLRAVVTRDMHEVLRDWRIELASRIGLVSCILAALSVVGWRVEQANRAVRIQATRDGLTGLANRRSLNEAMERELRRAARDGRPLSLVMIDLDDFKSYNDTYGHLAGDDCLRAVARTLEGLLRRPGDLAARYGGEEMALLLPGTDAAGAAEIATRVRDTLNALGIRHEGSGRGIVTLSAGIASCHPASRGVSPQSLMEAADQALYDAKANGRDTFVVHRDAA